MKYNKKTIIFVAIIILVISIVMFILTRKENIILTKSVAFKNLNYEISHEIKENRIEYEIKIMSRYPKTECKDAKVSFRIVGSVDTTVSDRTAMMPVTFETKMISLSDNCTYIGTFVYESEEAIYNYNKKNKLKINVKNAEGTIIK